MCMLILHIELVCEFQIVFCLCERLLKACDCEDGGGGPSFCTPIGKPITSTYLASKGRKIKKGCDEEEESLEAKELVIKESDDQPIYCTSCGDVCSTSLPNTPSKQLGISIIRFWKSLFNL